MLILGDPNHPLLFILPLAFQNSFLFFFFFFLQVFSHNGGGFSLYLVRRLQLRRREGCKKGGRKPGVAGMWEPSQTSSRNRESHRATLPPHSTPNSDSENVSKPLVTFFSSFPAWSLKQISAFRPTFVIHLL